VHAGEQLNTDPQKRSLSIVVRIYKLRAANAFLAAPYKAFGSADAEKLAFGGDLLDVRELVLTPGQKHEVVETMPLESSHLAVVALFRAPAEGRWRFAFKTKEAEKSGVTLGLHGCAMSVAAGTPDDAQPETLRLAGVNCP
jgi:type VI secretion system protein VasD